MCERNVIRISNSPWLTPPVIVGKKDGTIRIYKIDAFSEKKEMLMQAHEYGGHQGVDRTINLLKLRGYWVGINWNVELHVSYCEVCYTEKSYDWEENLPLVLFAYRTTKHATTGISPFQIMYGREPQGKIHLEARNNYEPSAYERFLREKLASIRDFVEGYRVESQQRQKEHYDRAYTRKFTSLPSLLKGLKICFRFLKWV